MIEAAKFPCIRVAMDVDAEAIVRVHHAAVHETAVTSYVQDVLNEWSPLPNESRCDAFRTAIVGGHELFCVTEDQSGVVGFGSIVPAACELRAVYVHARVARRGIGSAILIALQDLAVSLGCMELQMHATINAEACLTGPPDPRFQL